MKNSKYLDDTMSEKQSIVFPLNVVNSQKGIEADMVDKLWESLPIIESYNKFTNKRNREFN